MGALPEYATPGSFNLAKRIADGVDGFVATKCFLVGAIAVHRNTGSTTWKWRLSHASTGLGLPGAYGRTRCEALRMARAVNSAIDWSKVRRGGRHIGTCTGMTKARAHAVQATLQSFRHLAREAA